MTSARFPQTYIVGDHQTPSLLTQSATKRCGHILAAPEASFPFATAVAPGRLH